MTIEILKDKIKGLVYGQAMADAMGLGTEFLTKNLINYYYPNGLQEYSQIIQDKHRIRWKRGEWTDDTDQMLCILDSILEFKKVDYKDIAYKIYYWAYSGGRGIGRTVFKAISDPKYLATPHQVAETNWLKSGKNAAANGAVMRTAILGAWQYEDLEKVIQNTEDVAKITHYDPRCVGSAVLVTTAISNMLLGESDYDILYQSALAVSKNYDERIEEYLGKARTGLSKLLLDEKDKIGYTLKTLGAGFWALKYDDFKKAILDIIHKGGDADTNAAVAGALLGTKLGFSQLPKDWIEGLLNKEILDKKLEKYFELLFPLSDSQVSYEENNNI